MTNVALFKIGVLTPRKFWRDFGRYGHFQKPKFCGAFSYLACNHRVMCTWEKDSSSISRVFPCPLLLSALNIPQNTDIHLGIEPFSFILINTYTCKMNFDFCVRKMTQNEIWIRGDFGAEKLNIYV